MRHLAVLAALLVFAGCLAAPPAGDDDGPVGDDDDGPPPPPPPPPDGEIDAGPPDPEDPSCGEWSTGTLTGYNNRDSADDPHSGSLMEFTNLTQAFYDNVAIAAVDMSDWGADQYHFIDVRFGGVIGRVGVWDACRNQDCPDGNDCCTDNKQRFAFPGYLVDVEAVTAERLWGITDAENTLQDEIEYRLCGAFDPDQIANMYGVYR